MALCSRYRCPGLAPCIPGRHTKHSSRLQYTRNSLLAIFRLLRSTTLSACFPVSHLQKPDRDLHSDRLIYARRSVEWRSSLLASLLPGHLPRHAFQIRRRGTADLCFYCRRIQHGRSCQCRSLSKIQTTNHRRMTLSGSRYWPLCAMETRCH